MNLLKLAKNKIRHKPNWNVKSQITEECAELIVAINKYNRNMKSTNMDNIVEEMSDVIFCIKCFCVKYKISEKNIFNIAMDKTRERFPEELK